MFFLLSKEKEFSVKYSPIYSYHFSQIIKHIHFKQFRKIFKDLEYFCRNWLKTKLVNDKKELRKKEIYLGDIIISYQYIFPNKQNSILEKTFIHGFLHLLGFDHKKIKDFKIMNREENKILNSIS